MDEGTYVSYTIGFILSIALTIAAFFVALHSGVAPQAQTKMIVALLALAVIQFVVQMVFFLHFASGPNRAAKSLVFSATLGLLLIIIIGSIWIMNHLNYNMMASPQEMQQYINDQQGF